MGLEIAPGKDVEENPDLKEIGNIWNAVPTAKHWTPIDPIEGCITVNIGDGLQWWTDGLFKSTYHRVRAPKDGDNKVNIHIHSRSAYCLLSMTCMQRSMQPLGWPQAHPIIYLVEAQICLNMIFA